VSVRIRLFEAEDVPAVEACVREHQDLVRETDPTVKKGTAMAAGYVSWMLEQSAEKDGRIFVAESGGAIGGFVSVWVEDGFAKVSDLVVAPRAEETGIAAALLTAAEGFARDKRVSWLHIGVLAENAVDRAVFDEAGFAAEDLTLRKAIAGC
jgi:GNAT superfamily N-acetyltransferase